MTEVPSSARAEARGPSVPVRPQPNVYTVLLVIAILAICVTVGVVIWKLTSPMDAGYGIRLKHIFSPGTPLPDI
ncbi:MAG: hypothetical protein ACYTF6_02295 [Planctomycetota bacterium]|jgi:hypothetical protein